MNTSNPDFSNMTAASRASSSNAMLEEVKAAMDELEHRYGGQPDVMVLQIGLKAHLPISNNVMTLMGWRDKHIGLHPQPGLPVLFWRDRNDLVEQVAVARRVGFRRPAIFDNHGARYHPRTWTFAFEKGQAHAK